MNRFQEPSIKDETFICISCAELHDCEDLAIDSDDLICQECYEHEQQYNNKSTTNNN